MEAISHLEENERPLHVDTIEREFRGEEPLEVGLTKYNQAIEAHWAAKAARAMAAWCILSAQSHRPSETGACVVLRC